MTAGPQRERDSPAVAAPMLISLPAQVSGAHLHAARGRLLEGLQHPGGLVVECRQVQEVAPAALALLVAAYRAARQRGGHLAP